MKNIIAIQGIEGSNHHNIAQIYYGEKVALKKCNSFDALVESLLNNTATQGVMALENTIAGSIIPNYALIDANNLHICGEQYVSIHHHLMCLPNQTLNDISEVCSHPMALLQCKAFFKKYPHIKLIEDTDTADVAKRISDKKLKGVAAIAPKIAADIFGLQVLSDAVQTINDNATRFVIVQTKSPKNGIDQINKASLKFVLNHNSGSLAAVLNVLSDCQLNLTKIQSLPKIETPWKYAFFVDVTFNNYEDYKKASAIVKIMAQEFKVLGEYKNQRLT